MLRTGRQHLNDSDRFRKRLKWTLFWIGCKADRPGNPEPICHLNHLFIGVEALPGDLAEEILGQNALPETVAAFRKEFKLDLPPHERYVAWLGDLLKGDLGKSLANGRPVVDLIGWRFANTVFLHLPCSFRPQVKSWGSKTRRLIGNLMALERPNAGGLSLKPPLFT